MGNTTSLKPGKTQIIKARLKFQKISWVSFLSLTCWNSSRDIYVSFYPFYTFYTETYVSHFLSIISELGMGDKKSLKQVLDVYNI